MANDGELNWVWDLRTGQPVLSLRYRGAAARFLENDRLLTTYLGDQFWDGTPRSTPVAIPAWDKKPAAFRSEQLGDYYISIGLWREAAAEYARTQVMLNTYHVRGQDYYFRAVLRLSQGDREGYQALCRLMLSDSRFSSTADPEDGYQVAMVGLMAPGSPIDAQECLRFAEQAVEDTRTVWRVYALALAQYRAGNCDAAVRSCQECLMIDANWDPIWVYSLLAMAHHRLGHVDAAKEPLATAAKSRHERFLAMMDGGIGFVPHTWCNILQGEMHFREAWALVNGPSPSVDPRWAYLRGRSLLAIGRTEEANREFDAAAADPAVQDDPLYARLFNDLAWQHIVGANPHIRSPEKALALARRAVALAPTTGHSTQRSVLSSTDLADFKKLWRHSFARRNCWEIIVSDCADFSWQ